MNQHVTGSPARFTALAVLFEWSLAAAGALLGWLTGPWPWSTLMALSASEWLSGICVGGAVALLLLAAVVLVDRRPVWIFKPLQQTLRQHVVPLFRGTNTWHLLAIALSAGIGEELLFRGYCQAALGQWLPLPGSAWWALAASSLLFGICHWITGAYALVASAMGLVLGMLLLGTGNLAAPIAAHALYDFLALIYLTREPT